MGLLRFEEAYFERLWGGSRLAALYGKPLPERAPIGEAWMVSDHAACESVVSLGPFAGQSLRKLIETAPAAILGARPQLTRFGRFPLLLKLIDAEDVLSVQVHPDDATAARLNEPDVGKTEMWHVLDAAPGSPIFCGLHSGTTHERFAAAIADGTVQDLLTRFDARADMTVFVAAGTVHAIGAGIVLAEIQQNSDLTYRCHDWGRVDSNGCPRTLHIEKSIEAARFDPWRDGPAQTLTYTRDNATIEVLGACHYFAGEAVAVNGAYHRVTGGESFHILLVKAGALLVRAGADEAAIRPGEAVLIPGCRERFDIEGDGIVLDYYVPDLGRDIVAPLRDAGYDRDAILCLGGDPASSDLARIA